MTDKQRTPQELVYADRLIGLITSIPEKKRSAYINVVEALLMGAIIAESKNSMDTQSA